MVYVSQPLASVLITSTPPRQAHCSEAVRSVHVRGYVRDCECVCVCVCVCVCGEVGK